jgi:hypothetical protein
MSGDMTTPSTAERRCPDCGGVLSADALPWGELRCAPCKQYVILERPKEPRVVVRDARGRRLEQRRRAIR